MKKQLIFGVALSLVSAFAVADTVTYETDFNQESGMKGRFYTYFTNPIDNSQSGYSNFGGNFQKYYSVKLKKGQELRVWHQKYAGDAQGQSTCKIYINGELVKSADGINKSNCSYIVN